MSCIYFHSRHGEAKLRGAERAYAGCLVNDLAISTLRVPLDDFSHRPSVLRYALPDSFLAKINVWGDGPVENWRRMDQALPLQMRVGDGDDCRLQRVQITADHRLQRLHQCCRGDARWGQIAASDVCSGRKGISPI